MDQKKIHKTPCRTTNKKTEAFQTIEIQRVALSENEANRCITQLVRALLEIDEILHREESTPQEPEVAS